MEQRLKSLNRGFSGWTRLGVIQVIVRGHDTAGNGNRLRWPGCDGQIMPEEGRGTLPTHGIHKLLNVHALHKRERRSELPYVVNLNFCVRISFKDNTANESRQLKDGEGGTRARRVQGPAL